MNGAGTPRRTDDGHQFTWTEYTYPSTAVVETVAQVTDQGETELPILQSQIDCDALDALVTSSRDVEVTFQYSDLTVTVTGGGDLHIRSE